MSSAARDYSSYLEIEKLLSIQVPKSDGPEHDEMLFIIIHQVYELWFKQLLHELDYLGEKLYQNDGQRASHTLRRMLKILKTIVSQIDVLETMTPLEFNSFRAYLETASGFQSVQFRELEFALGYKRASILDNFPAEFTVAQKLRARYTQPTLWDAFLHFLATNGIIVPEDQLKRDVTQPVTPSEAVQTALIEVYHTKPMLANICERLVDLDEGIQEWRYRHVKMVQRTIGSKKGTGGSSGAAYLQSTLKPLFPDLWAIRQHL